MHTAYKGAAGKAFATHMPAFLSNVLHFLGKQKAKDNLLSPGKRGLKSGRIRRMNSFVFHDADS
jgi:hypothetical protein